MILMTKQELINLIDRKKNKEKIALEESKKRLDSLIPQMQEDLEMVSILAEEKIILSKEVYNYSILVGEEKKTENNNEPKLNVFSFNKTNSRKKEYEISFNPFNSQKKFSYYFITEDNKDIDDYKLLSQNKKTYSKITAQFIQDFCDEYEKWHKAFHEKWLEELKKEF